ncbi:MAG: DUF4097 family beta strand repeat-containing protein [Bacteroidota bacterium]
MKKVGLTIIICIIGFMAKAQEDYTRSLSGIQWVKIESNASMKIKTHSKNELLIKANEPYRIPEKAKGLKLVGEGGTDNTDVGFSVLQEGNNLIVKNLQKSEEAEIYLPASQNISVKSKWSGSIYISGFTGEVEASALLNGGIEIEDVSGPLTANSLNGGIDVRFNGVSQSAPSSISSTNGELDISLPANTPADLTLGTVNGEIYTNFELSVPDKNGLRAVVSRKVKGAINNGGVKIQLSTTNGNIYLRKQ